MAEPSSLTLAGSGLCGSSALLAAINGDSPIVIGLGIAGGIAFGAIGIVQRLRDNEAKRLRARIESIEGELYQAKDTARARLDESLDRISAMKHVIADLTAEIAAARCPNADASGRARCSGPDADTAEFKSA
jgi:hypothetical protein